MASRLLLAGLGAIGARHLHHIRADPDLALVGVVDPDPSFDPGVPVFPNLTAADVAADGIVVATPTATHAPLSIEAARRGWHVLVEKPVAHDLAAADAMIDAARTRGVRVLVGHHRRHHPALARLRDVVRSGAIGRPVAASLMWLMAKPRAYFDVPWRAGLDGSPIRQNLVHDVDMLRWILGDVTDVAGLASNAERGRGAPRIGRRGAALRGWRGGDPDLRRHDADPLGLRGRDWRERPHPAQRRGHAPHRGHAGRGVLPVAPGLVRRARDWSEAPAATRKPAPEGVPLARQLAHFAEVIDGRAAPVCDAADGRATLDAVLRIEAAAMACLG